jgi:hypothetical protein
VQQQTRFCLCGVDDYSRSIVFASDDRTRLRLVSANSLHLGGFRWKGRRSMVHWWRCKRGFSLEIGEEKMRVGETMRPMDYVDAAGWVSSGWHVRVKTCSRACSPLSHYFYMGPTHDAGAGTEFSVWVLKIVKYFKYELVITHISYLSTNKWNTKWRITHIFLRNLHNERYLCLRNICMNSPNTKWRITHIFLTNPHNERYLFLKNICMNSPK